MRQVTESTGKLERSFAIGAIVAAILVGAVLYFLYPSSFKNNLYGGTSQGQSQTGSSGQYDGSASSSASSPPSPASGGSSSGSSTGNSGY
jgi:hypothetical protein